MKKLSTLLILTMLAFSGFSHAQPAETELLIGGNSVVITVKGLVCEFCVKTIEKVFLRQPEVDHVSIDLSKATVTVTFKKDMTIDDIKIRKLVKDAGYDIDEITRPRRVR